MKADHIERCAAHVVSFGCVKRGGGSTSARFRPGEEEEEGGSYLVKNGGNS